MNLIKSTSIWGKSENQNNEINVSGVCVAIKFFPCFFLKYEWCVYIWIKTQEIYYKVTKISE